MNFKDDFIRIGNVDISSLKEKVLSISEEEWHEFDQRQNRHEVHKYTHTIRLIFDDDGRHHNPTFLPRFFDFKDDLSPVINLITRHYNMSLKNRRLMKKHGNGYIIRMILVKLDSGGVIAPHIDGGYSLSHAHRIHMPVISNDKVSFKVGNATKVMREGEAWEINNKHLHGVENNSPTDRIHLITDWVIPGERCCCGKKWRPHEVCNEELCGESSMVTMECGCYTR